MSATKFKVYDVDGPLGGPAGGDPVVDQKSKAIFAAAARRRDAGHNERYLLFSHQPLAWQTVSYLIFPVFLRI